MTNTLRTMLGAAAVCALLLGMAPLVARGGGLRGEGAPVNPSRSAAQVSGAPANLPAGDLTRGKGLVESSGCFDCHRIGDRGSRLGPDLSDIGDRRTPDRIQQAVVAPDDEVLPENRFVRLVTKDGATITGRLLNQDAISVQLINPKEELKSYLESTLREYTIVDKGMMPSSQGRLTGQQIADMVTYLASLKGN